MSDESSPAAASAEVPAPQVESKPRVWPLFVVSLFELCFASALQGIAAVVIVLTMP